MTIGYTCPVTYANAPYADVECKQPRKLSQTPKIGLSIKTMLNDPWFLVNSLQKKRDKMLGKPHILSLFPNMFNKINKTWALM